MMVLMMVVVVVEWRMAVDVIVLCSSDLVRTLGFILAIAKELDISEFS